MKFSKIKKITEKGKNSIYHLTVEKNCNFFGNEICLHNCGFRGEIKVILENTNHRPFEIKIGDRIAQMVFNKVELPDFTIVERVAESERGENGFGSTGIKS